MAQLSIRLFGSFSAELDGNPVSFAYSHTKAILAYLATQPGRLVRRVKLAGLIWPDSSQEAAQEDLRQALSRLRKSLGDGSAFLPFLITDRESVQLNPQADVQVDLAQFQQALAACTAHSHRHAQACPTCARYRNNAAQLFCGEFLEDLALPDSDLFEEWASAWREQIHNQAVETFRWLADFYQHGGNLPAALTAARRGVALEPLSESACQQLVSLLAQDGQTDQAISHFRKFLKYYQEELAQSPPQSLANYVEGLRVTPPVRFQPTSLDGLPVPLTPMIGRQVELSELDAWISDPLRRLITILGPGGIGKTRLALAAAHQHKTAFRDGVNYICFTSTHTRVDFLRRLARSIGMPVNPGVELLPGIVDQCTNKDRLLILDGFENVADAVDILELLLHSSPNLVILATTRERINLPGEWIFPLGGLPCPAPGIWHGIEMYSAVELFVLQAQQGDPDFKLTPENRETISTICRLVGGMPLAIELASAWVRVMPCYEITAELQRGLDLLSSSTSGDRQAGIRAVFEKSWMRLLPEEQRVFRQVTVFRGGFDRQAAQQVAGASMETLIGLVNKTFVRGSAEGRYHVHDLMIQFGLEKLHQVSEFEETHRRHCLYYLETAEIMESTWLSSRDVRSFFWLVKEQDNLHSALDWANVQHPELAPRLIRCMHADLHQAGVHELHAFPIGSTPI